MRGNLQLLICSALLCAAGLGGLGAVVPDLAQVEGIDKYPGSEAGKRLLQENGFVVEPMFSNQIFTIYKDGILPYYIDTSAALPHYATADSVHNTFHVIFEKQLRNLETGMRQRVLTLTQGLLALLQKDASPEAQFACDYFRVADYLLRDASPGLFERRVSAELNLIYAASGVADSPLFGYRMDYSQFKPRGFYTETPELRAFFRAMSWYGNSAFRLWSSQETAIACLIARTLGADAKLVDLWNSIDRVYTGFLGSCDDLTPIEYAAALASGERPEVALAKLRNPRINSMVLSPGTMVDWQQQTKGMRFLGKRYLIDSEVFMNLTAPKVPGRGFPTGLDMMAANGSTRARELALASPSAATPEYAPALDGATSLAGQARKADPPTHYSAFLKVLDSLAQPPVSNAPAFAKTPAYADKNLMTSLAAWSCERHAWALQAKQPAIYAGYEPPKCLQGYVEPNPVFFDSMHDLIAITTRLLKEVPGCDTAKLDELDKVVLLLREMVNKELAEIPFDAGEDSFLTRYYERMGDLQDFPTMGADVKTFPHMGLIIDAHSEMLSQQCLEVATGDAMPIYVAVQYGGKWYLCIGGVYSYYEFTQPIQHRLTDDEWRSGKAIQTMKEPPALPAWTSSFVVTPNASTAAERAATVAAAIEEMRQGKESFLAERCFDPELNAYLEQAVKPGGELVGKQNHVWALELGAKRLGHKMAPTLFEFVRTAPLNSTATGSRFAAELSVGRVVMILKEVVSVDDFATITALLKDDPERGKAALWAIDRPFDKRVADYLFDIASTNRDPEIRQSATRGLARIAGKDQTRKVLGLIRRASPRDQDFLFEFICGAWYPQPYAEEERFPSESTISEQEAMRQELKEALASFIKANRNEQNETYPSRLQKLLSDFR